MKRFTLALTTLVAVLALQGTPRAAAQEVEVQGPLAGAPAVIGLRVYREMRFQLQLHGAMTLTDEYSRAILVGGQLNFHLTDWLGLGGWIGYAAANLDTSITDQVATAGQTNTVNVLSLPKRELFPEQVGRIKMIIAPQVTFIPLRGKLGIFEKLFVDTDFYVFGGVGLVQVEERAEILKTAVAACKASTTLSAQQDCLEASQLKRESRMAVAPTFGAGLSLYMADFVAMTIEWRGLPFSWNTSGTDESGDGRGDFPDNQIDKEDRLSHFNHMIALGFAFYLPTEPGISTAGTDE
jgi:outer membrane beta-barrel protein